MNANLKLYVHDIKNIFIDRKTILVVSFLTLITLAIGLSFSLIMQSDMTNLLTQLKDVSKIEDTGIFVAFFINIFSFIIFSTYPFILGMLIISYLKEFGELELMMLFPINRKMFFMEKIFSIFTVSLLFSWLSILLNSIIRFFLLNGNFEFNTYKILYLILVLPVWLLFLSCLTVLISSFSKDSKDANQKSLILPFVIYGIIQFLFILKVNIFTEKIIFIPLVTGVVGIILMLMFIKRRFSLEKILYN